MWQDQLTAKITEQLTPNDHIRALFLGGSFGKGEADEYSDIDLIAIVAKDNQSAFTSTWKATLEDITPVVFWNEMPERENLFNAITDQWQRIDLITIDPEALKYRSQDGLKPLFDKDNLFDTAPKTIPWTGTNKGYVTYLISEFIRMLGLLAVGVGRKEYLGCVAGVGMMYMLLFNLLKEEVEQSDKGGMLAWSRLFSKQQLDLLAGIPAAPPERQSIIDANLALAKAFLPRARKMAERLDIDWPRDFEDATWDYLNRELGIEKSA